MLERIVKNRKALSLERIIQVAEDAFTKHPFEHVAISEVARRAHCSTSMIYDAFGGKEDLFRYVIGRRLPKSWPGEPAKGDEPALVSLIKFIHRRMRILGDEDARARRRAIARKSEIMAQTMINDRDQLLVSLHGEIDKGIGAAIHEGSMRSNPIECVRYILCASSAYETVLLPLSYGVNRPIDYKDILRKAFTPLLTRKGVAILEDYLARSEDEPGDMIEAPIAAEAANATSSPLGR